ncbi:MAG: Lon protease [Mycoplasmataceae bacterium]|nr:MAG: Lon protease [Mycoplasmataceae bacterium]
MTVIERLVNKKNELEGRLSNLYHDGSQRRETLEHKISKIEELISVYQVNSPLVDLSEAEQILNQQIGFSEQKLKILNKLRIKKEPLIIFLVGPPGVGKTNFAQILTRALRKKFFSISLGGISDASVLAGTSENSSGVEVGLLTKALLETKTSDPLILLDELDKVTYYGGNSSIHNWLNNILDPANNQKVLDYYLDVELDFSQTNFVITANDAKKSLIIYFQGFQSLSNYPNIIWSKNKR